MLNVITVDAVYYNNCDGRIVFDKDRNWQNKCMIKMLPKLL